MGIINQHSLTKGYLTTNNIRGNWHTPYHKHNVWCTLTVYSDLFRRLNDLICLLCQLALNNNNNMCVIFVLFTLVTQISSTSYWWNLTLFLNINFKVYLLAGLFGLIRKKLIKSVISRLMNIFLCVCVGLCVSVSLLCMCACQRALLVVLIE